MKKTIFLLFFFLTAANTIGQTVVYDTLQYAKKHHQNRLALFKSETIVKGKIIFLGNSITEFGDWQKLLNDATVINRGIAGDNTFGILARLRDVTDREPSKLFIKIGINDISQNIPIAIIIKNISTIIETVKKKSPKTQIYLHSILPTNNNVKNEFPDAYNKNGRVASANRQLRKLTKKQHVPYIDIHTLFKDKEGKLSLQYANPDGLHLNDSAYQAWIQFLKENHYL